MIHLNRFVPALQPVTVHKNTCTTVTFKDTDGSVQRHTQSFHATSQTKWVDPANALSELELLAQRLM
ncbi:MAG: hypothetical protein KC476_07450 [Cyanobacteria bacterium HKST-UBA06]|nr:hypothetical protein [Cyanobacteria bacterium HKST-UBA04]MCA9807775.1 hypothetical protein [Cyanobacteria bacterium HKST-UBA06]MCA9840652.1 hypothetical protein [Cyanobacteria bacterium HKST-UBA03]